MKKFLLCIVALSAMNSLFAQVPAPITGTPSVCLGSTTMLNDATTGGVWTSSNTAIATVGATTGVLTGVASGTVTVIYTISTGHVSAVATVNPDPALIAGAPSVCIGGSTITLSDATAGGVWSSANPFVASVGSSSGVVTAISVGVIPITYTLPTGCFTNRSVTVNSVAISGASVSCIGGTPLALTDASPGGTWASSNPAVATVGAGSGVVSPVSAGSAYITYTLGPGCSSGKSITVKSLPVVTPSSLTGCVGDAYQLAASPAGGSWVSSNPAIASVNFLGIVTGVSAGTATIQYTAAGGCAISVPVTINPLPAPITGLYNYVYQGLTISLGDPTPGGTWSSGNPSLATVNPGTGTVTGAAAGLVFISYTLPTGCLAYYRVEVNPIPATANLYAWYPFCGDSTDHSGNGRDLINHGIVTTPATLITDRFGSPNSAYHFNGVNSMMNYTTFYPNNGTPPDFTYSCWVRTSVNQSAIIMYNGNPALDGFGFVINNGTLGVAGMQVGVLFGATGGLYASQAISPGVWHNLVLVKSGGFYNFYIDNAAGVFFLETPSPLFTDVFALGLNYHSTLPGMGPVTGAFNGDIDDVAYINRQLTGPERLSIFNYNPDANRFTLGNDTTICTDAIDLSPVPQTIGGLYSWSTYNGFSYTQTDTTHTTLTEYPLTGPFGNRYVLTISKPYGCSASDTIVVYKAPIPVSLGADQNVCIGDTINLTNFFPSASFLWSTGDTAHSIRVTTSGSYWLTVDSIHTSGPGNIDTAICVGRDTVNINFHAVPFVSLPETPTDCQGNGVKLYTYPDTSYTYLWSTGAATDTITATTSGVYWVRVNDGGCVRYDTTRVSIVFDTVTFHLGPDTAICRNAAPFTRFASLNPIVSYQWTPTAGLSISNSAVAAFNPDTSAEYYLTVRYPGCPDIVDSFHVDVQPNPTVFMGGNRNVCYGDTIHIAAQITPAWYTHYIYNWTPATGLDHSNTSTVVFNTLTGAATDTATIKMYLTVTTPAWTPTLAQGCISRDSGIIFVHPVNFDTALLPVTLCPGDSVQLIPSLNTHGTNTGVVLSAFRWSPGMYLDDSMSSTPWVHPITSVDYRVITYSQYGCRDTLGVTVKVNPGAVMSMADSAVIYPGDSYQIVPQTNCIYFQWYPPVGLDNPFLSNPVAIPDVSTTYYVHGQTEAGCSIFDSFRIHIDPLDLIGIPNAFTPGSSVNSRFYILKKGIVALNYFHIFDRWGNMVYDSRNIDEGWDGTYKGKPQPFGVYVYEVEAQTVKGVVFTRRGNVTLIR